MANPIDPATDCPACPECKGPFGVPMESAECEGRFYGPRDATLFCVACGVGWVGSHGEVAQARAAQDAFEATL